jgi:long-chain fatty acid transport protein
MKRASIIVFSCLVICLLASVSVVQAGGFALYEWSNRGIAMGTTGYAFGGDASVIATNPALMTQHEGGEALVGFATITPSSDIIRDGVKHKTEDKTHIVPHAYYTQQVQDNVWLGIGMYTRFGLGTKYKEGWAGKANLQYVNLQSVTINPNIAFKFNDNFSLAVGADILKGGIQLEKGSFSANTNGYGLGGNIGLHYKYDDQWSAGFTYRTPIKFFTSGSASVGSVIGKLHSEKQTIEATLPSSYTLGIGYKPLENWSIEFDTVFTRWELTDKMVYGGFVKSTDYLDYKNSWRLQLGTEYWAKEWLALRFGYVYDVTPTVNYEASYMLPANDRQLYSTGLGFKFNDIKIDWSFMYVTTKERTGLTIGNKNVEFKNGKTWISGLSVGYEF